MDGVVSTMKKKSGRTMKVNTGNGSAVPGDQATVDLNNVFAPHSDHTYLLKVTSGIMEAAGIRSGDSILVDRAMEPANGKIVVAEINGELFIRRLEISNGKMQFVPANGLAPIVVDHISYQYIWGVVIYVIHQL